MIYVAIIAIITFMTLWYVFAKIEKISVDSGKSKMLPLLSGIKSDVVFLIGKVYQIMTKSLDKSKSRWKNQQYKKIFNEIEMGKMEQFSGKSGTHTIILEEGGEMNIYLERAMIAERTGDYLSARVAYMSFIEDLKRSGAPKTDIQQVMNIYEEFVRRDPVFKKLVSVLLPYIKSHPGMLQSDISTHFISVDWSTLCNHNRPVVKEDIYYALYFAEKLGLISRTKKGRSYELRIKEDKALEK
ncbi:MAG: hypothetical protein HQK98_06850 [Nitrospirae bacterium]|nr:hypothetical protein [Nitrospirota bacterium]